MTLSKDEKIEVSEDFNRAMIDLHQGMSYFSKSKYDQGADNWTIAIATLEKILKKVRD